jgi:hypothetical protein
MVNGEFPGPAPYGFEMVDFRVMGSPIARNGINRKFTDESIRPVFSQSFGKLNPMQSLAIYPRPLVSPSTARHRSVID